MSDPNPAATRMRVAVVAWVSRQSEPFDLAELRGRFVLNIQRSVRMAQWLVANGHIRSVQPSAGSNSAVFKRIKPGAT